MGQLTKIRPIKVSLLEVVTMAVEALWSNRLRTTATSRDRACPRQSSRPCPGR